MSDHDHHQSPRWQPQGPLWKFETEDGEVWVQSGDFEFDSQEQADRWNTALEKALEDFES